MSRATPAESHLTYSADPEYRIRMDALVDRLSHAVGDQMRVGDVMIGAATIVAQAISAIAKDDLEEQRKLIELVTVFLERTVPQYKPRSLQ